jgi:hypothetical protein
MQIWLTVAILFFILLVLHGRYLCRDYRFLLTQWLELESALQARRLLLLNMTAKIPDLETAIGADLKLLLQRAPDRYPKRWLQRAALESRLSIRTEQVFNQIKIASDLGRRLDHLDNTIQLSVRLYQIGANRYNRRREAFPANLLAALAGLPAAPDIEIDAIRVTTS